MTSEKGGVIHDVKNEERGRHVKDRGGGIHDGGMHDVRERERGLADMTSETEGRGRHDVRDRGEGGGMMSKTGGREEA